MNRNSCGGSDGFSVSFFIACWDFIQSDVCKAIHNFCNKCTILSFMNATNIALIPKVKHAKSVLLIDQSLVVQLSIWQLQGL